jgi:hypothetical protein
MQQVLGGVVLVIARIAAFIEVHSHQPIYAERRFGRGAGLELQPGLSQTPYDILRIGAWALVIIGGLVVVTGLIRYFAAQTRRSQ